MKCIKTGKCWVLGVDVPQTPGDWRCGCCPTRPVFPLALGSPLLQSLLCLAVLSYNMAAVSVQQGDAATPYSNTQSAGSRHTDLTRTIRVARNSSVN